MVGCLVQAAGSPEPDTDTTKKEGGKKKDDDIVDADFEVVDEEEKEAK